MKETIFYLKPEEGFDFQFKTGADNFKVKVIYNEETGEYYKLEVTKVMGGAFIRKFIDGKDGDETINLSAKSNNNQQIQRENSELEEFAEYIDNLVDSMPKHKNRKTVESYEN